MCIITAIKGLLKQPIACTINAIVRQPCDDDDDDDDDDADLRGTIVP